jgi:DNA-binding PadR family transcriptional regulator
VLGHALLALLSRQSLTGYELTKRFYGSVAFCWHAHTSQIYAELARLEASGWISAKREPGAGRGRKLYALAEAGRAGLQAWLRTPPPALALKDEWLLRVWAIDQLPAGDGRAVLDACRRLHEERLATYRTLLRDLTREHGGVETTRHESLVGPYLCLQQGIWHEEMYVRWCRWAVARLAARRRRHAAPRPRTAVDLHAAVSRARGAARRGAPGTAVTTRSRPGGTGR